MVVPVLPFMKEIPGVVGCEGVVPGYFYPETSPLTFAADYLFYQKSVHESRTRFPS
jgi:hypothetical protein